MDPQGNHLTSAAHPPSADKQKSQPFTPQLCCSIWVAFVVAICRLRVISLHISVGVRQYAVSLRVSTVALLAELVPNECDASVVTRLTK